ncbi:sugar ABC transporter substrate-binding protein [Nocardiopsis sp. CA-288880]|uniref:sugar ABC transporter substrate-binding protein n=1 Tax=Nocardiopsis sp. CA-288880 TaxID=3239995 RepID=UPI003D95245E
MRKRQRVLASVAGAASLALIAACSPGSGDGGGDGTIQFLGPEDPAFFEPLIEAFEASHEGYTVEYTQVPFDQYNSTVQQRLSAGDESIDVYAVDQPRVPWMAAQGLLEDLSDLEDRAREATTEGQYSTGIHQDRLWALPVWNSTQLMFVNQDALAAADVEGPGTDPSERWTWEQTAEAAEAAQEAGTEWGLLLEQTDFYYQLQPLMESKGGGSGVVGEDMLDQDVANAEWVEAMEWFGATFEDGLSPRGVGTFETSPLFSGGDVAFFVGGPWDLGEFADSDVDWTVAPMPYFEGGEEVTPSGSWSWGVNPASQAKDAARLFLEYAALDPAGNLASTERQTIIPANTEAAEEYLPRMDALAGDRSAGAADLISYEVANTGVVRPVTVGYAQFEEVMNTAFADIRNGSDAASRLEQAGEQLEDAWAPLR